MQTEFCGDVVGVIYGLESKGQNAKTLCAEIVISERTIRKILFIDTADNYLPDEYTVKNVNYHRRDNNADTDEAKWFAMLPSRYEATLFSVVAAFECHNCLLTNHMEVRQRLRSSRM